MKKYIILVCLLSFLLTGWFWGEKREYNPYYQYAVWDIFDDAEEYIQRSELGRPVSFEEYRAYKKVALLARRAHDMEPGEIDKKLKDIGFMPPDLYLDDPPTEQQLRDVRRAIERIEEDASGNKPFKKQKPPIAQPKKRKGVEDWEAYLDEHSK